MKTGEMHSRSASDTTYVLGNHADELARIDRQAAGIAAPTRLALHAAGIVPGLRVLDLGTGLGHVARIVGELVGSSGSVLGIDQSDEALAIASRRVEEAGDAHISFISGDVAHWRSPQPFDAIVERLVLFHLPDPVAVVRHHTDNLHAGGRFVAIDFDIGGCRAEPAVGIVQDAVGWVEQAFSAAGASPRIGARLAMILAQAGLQDVATFGIQAYLAPRDPSGPALLTGVVRSLSHEMIRRGIATAEQIGLATLERRIDDELKRADAVFLPPTVVGAWGRTSEAT